MLAICFEKLTETISTLIDRLVSDAVTNAVNQTLLQLVHIRRLFVPIY